MPKYLTDITKEDLAAISELAAFFYTPREIAIIQQIDIAVFVEGCEVEGTDAFNAFYGGRLLSESELRKSVIKLAKSGSSPAQTMALEMLNASKMKMLDR